jgi:hypothetical protein
MTFLVACTSATANGAGRRADQNVLSAAEIEAANVGTLHDAIVLLRPHFLFTRGRTSMRPQNTLLPGILVNSVPQPSLESLRAISARDVQYVRFLSAPDATTRFGTGYMAGAIEVVLK